MRAARGISKRSGCSPKVTRSLKVARTTSFGRRWIEQLVVRYNAEGPDTLGDLRQRNGTSATILKPELLAKLRVRLTEPPGDGGVWTSPKVAAWMAQELGLEKVCAQRGWEALNKLRWSIRVPRPKNPKAATPEEEAAFKKTRGSRRRGSHETSRPTGRSLRDRRTSSRLEAGHAARLGAGRDRTILLVLDNAGWHGETGLDIPDGVRLIFLPPYTPELQPAETLWELVDEPLANQHIGTIEELEDIIAKRCVALADQRATIKSRTGFHWWPKIAAAK